jgi:hypothetical protein
VLDRLGALVVLGGLAMLRVRGVPVAGAVPGAVPGAIPATDAVDMTGRTA